MSDLPIPGGPHRKIGRLFLKALRNERFAPRGPTVRLLISAMLLPLLFRYVVNGSVLYCIHSITNLSRHVKQIILYLAYFSSL